MAVRASPAFRTSESKSRSTPSPRKTHCAGSGKKDQSATATSRHTTAPVIAWRLSRLVTLSPPPLRFERPEGEEQRQHDAGQVVDEILGVDQPAREAVEVIDEREILEHPAQAAPRELGPPSHDPEREQDPEGAEAGHDLVLGQGRDRKSTRLNSSHLVISYAVFCLKKKSTPIETTIPSREHRSAQLLG